MIESVSVFLRVREQVSVCAYQGARESQNECALARKREGAREGGDEVRGEREREFVRV